jgi:hypothetical protein
VDDGLTMILGRGINGRGINTPMEYMSDEPQKISPLAPC